MAGTTSRDVRGRRLSRIACSQWSWRVFSGCWGSACEVAVSVVGVNQVREAAKANKVFFAVVAADASANSLDKIVPLLNARRVRFIEVPSAADLGAAVGRDQTAVVGIVDRQLGCRHPRGRNGEPSIGT